jgi:hypothetical protein
MFKPPVGAIVTVTTRYRNDYIWAAEDWVYNTYENVTVMQPETWMKPDEIKVSSDTPKMPFRVIKLKNIDSFSNDMPAATHDIADIREVNVTGSKGNSYTVVVKDGIAISCTCPGFTYRRRCRHLNEVTEKEMA